MKTIKLIFFIGSMSALFFSCKKEEKTTNTELLTNACWKPLSKIVDTTNDGIDNGNEQIQACDLDNVECLFENGTGSINLGTVLCAAEATTSTWSWVDASQTQMNYHRGAIPVVLNIMQLDATTLKYNIVLDFTSTGGDYSKTTVTATH